MSQELVLKSVKLDNGEVIGYRECGEGKKTLVLIHGNMTSSKHWDIFMDKLKHKFKIYALDLRGFGKSTYNTPINSIKDFSEDVKFFVDKLELGELVVAGWSTGGGVAMQFTADYPNYVEKLILIESVGVKGYPIFKKDVNGKPIIGEFLKSKEEVAEDPIQVKPVLVALESKNKEFYKTIWNLTIYTHNQPKPQKYEEYLEDMLTQRNLVDVDYALLTFNITNEFNGVVMGSGDVDKILIPTLVIQGDRDYVVPIEMGQDIAKYIGQNAELEILEDSGHSPLIDQLDRLIDLIVKFVER